MKLQEIQGRCHCQLNNFVLKWPVAAPVVGRACSCSYCVSNGAIWTSHPQAELVFNEQLKNTLTSYAFGHKTGNFLSCNKCSSLCLATCKSRNKTIAVINTTILTDVVLSDSHIVKTNFDSESINERLARRDANWTPVIGSILS